MRLAETARAISRGLLIGLFAALALALVMRLAPDGQPGQTFTLAAPPFVQAAYAAGSPAAAGDTSFLDTEAGIAAYFQSPSPISLGDVDHLYRTIEISTSTYIIGSLAVPDYPESEDVHIYVHVDGWVLAYYQAADPVGKIFDWRSYTGDSAIPTKFDDALGIVAAEIGAPLPSIKYYHFQYPNATHLMLIAESSDAADAFEVTLPGAYSFYQRSWSAYANGGGCCYKGRYFVDGAEINAIGGYGWYTAQGLLTAAQLAQAVSHTITINNQESNVNNYYGGLALLYRVP